MSRHERLGKDSVLVDGENFDLYAERQHLADDNYLGRWATTTLAG